MDRRLGAGLAGVAAGTATVLGARALARRRAAGGHLPGTHPAGPDPAGTDWDEHFEEATERQTRARGVTINRPPGEVRAFWNDLDRLGRTVDQRIVRRGQAEISAAPGGKGTELRLRLRYSQPGGRVGAAVARLGRNDPDQLVRDALRRVKQVLEAGEAVRVDGQPAARGPVGERVTRAVRQVVTAGGRP